MTAESRIENALDREVSYQFEEKSLGELVELIRTVEKIPVVLDVVAMDEYGLSADSRISSNISGVSLQAALQHMLRPHELTVTISNDALMVTTEDGAEQRQVTRVYCVCDLATVDEAQKRKHPNESYDAAGLAKTIVGTLAPETWNEVGGPGAVTDFGDALVASTTLEVHEKLKSLLSAVRRAVTQKYDGCSPIDSYPAGTSRDLAIYDVLGKTVDFHADREPIEELILRMKTRYGIECQINPMEMDSDKTVSVQLTGVRLGAALSHLLRPNELFWGVRDEAVIISEEPSDVLTIRLYPVRDLVELHDRQVKDEKLVDFDFESLIDVIAATVAPDSWDNVGGIGSIGHLVQGPLLVISQTEDVHRQIGSLLASIRKATGKRKGGPS